MGASDELATCFHVLFYHGKRKRPVVFRLWCWYEGQCRCTRCPTFGRGRGPVAHPRRTDRQTVQACRWGESRRIFDGFKTKQGGRSLLANKSSTRYNASTCCRSCSSTAFIFLGRVFYLRSTKNEVIWWSEYDEQTSLMCLELGPSECSSFRREKY